MQGLAASNTLSDWISRLLPRILVTFIVLQSGHRLFFWLTSDVRRYLTGPKSTHWLWGVKWDMYSKQPHGYYLEWKRRFGDVYKFRGAFGSTMVVLTDPLAVGHILGTQRVYDYQKPEGGREWFGVLVGKGILWAEGEIHAHKRRKLAPAFTPQAIRDLTPVFNQLASKLAEEWTNLVDSRRPDSNTEKSKTQVDVSYWTNRISLDAIGLAGFNFDFCSIASSDAGVERHPLARTFDGLTSTAGSFSSFLVSALLFKFPLILKVLDNSPRIQMMKASRLSMGKTVVKLWREALEAGAAVAGSDAAASTALGGKTILELLVKAQLEQKGANSYSMSDEEVTDEMTTMIFAGYETTSCVMTWAIFELALHQSVQTALREEIVNALGLASEPTFDDMSAAKLPLLDAVVNETIRLHPPVLELHRVALRDDWVPLSQPLNPEARHPRQTLHIPKGTTVAIPLNVMQRDEEVWGPDAEVFDPSRWMKKQQAVNEGDGVARKKLMAFSEGPRVCIGRVFAMTEIKSFLITLLRQFAFDPTEETFDVEEFVSFVVRTRVKGREDLGNQMPCWVRKVD